MQPLFRTGHKGVQRFEMYNTPEDNYFTLGYNDDNSDSDSNGLYIKKGGNVGIGTNSPEAKLHLEGGNLRVRGEHNEDTADIGAFYAENLSQGIGIGYNRIVAVGSNTDQNILIMPKGNGNVGIGKTNPEAKLDVYGHIRLSAAHGQHSILKCEGNGFKIFLKDGRSSYNDRTATWDGDSNWDYSSDKKLKTNILDEKNILERLIQLNVKNYNWKDKPDQNPKPIGFITQDVKSLFPYVASESVNEETKETSLTLKYNSFGVLAVGAIKELNDKFEFALEKLTKKVDALAKKVK